MKAVIYARVSSTGERQSTSRQVADLTDYMTSFWVIVFCAAYLLFYALVGSKPVKK